MVKRSPATDPSGSARQVLVQRALDQLLVDGRPEQSLRSLASALGLSHSLLLYHFGSLPGLLQEVHAACELRLREQLESLRATEGEPVVVMRAMWRQLAAPILWPLYRLGFALGSRVDLDRATTERVPADWARSLTPLITALGVPDAAAAGEAQLWLATCRGLLWELVTGADPATVEQAAERFFDRYRPTRQS